ncbi:MAG: hypothetical protein MUE51_05485 [Thermoleophilia bacterium]|jgi:hypothetical protein|nr:hypothetical protein [Thermoleophilia bacterium]
MHALSTAAIDAFWVLADVLGRWSPLALLGALLLVQDATDPRRLAAYVSAGPFTAVDLAWTAALAYRGTKAAQTGH